jgi:chromosome segregation ATPase
MQMAAQYGQSLMKQNGSLQKQLSSLQTDHQTLLDNQSSEKLNRQKKTDSAFISSLEEANQELEMRVDSLEGELQKTLEAGRANILELESRRMLLDQGKTHASELNSKIEELEVSHSIIIVSYIV